MTCAPGPWAWPFLYVPIGNWEMWLCIEPLAMLKRIWPPPAPRSSPALLPRLTPERSAPGSWQRIGGASPPRGRSSQPPRPRVMHEVSAREGSREAFTGETTGQVLSRETGLIPRCRSSSLTRRQHLPWRIGLHGKNLARSKTLCTWRSSLHGTWETSSVSGRDAGPAHEGKSRTMSMHADEESDEGVVPMKRSNNEGLSSAETVEGRTSPKGNGGQTAAARTLRRDTASNGLAAVRRAARQSKTVRFTALLHHITTDLLKQSYFALARDAAPGTDGVTWQAYGESLEE